ncbi:hypothetical protein BGZ50_002936 [Haplosporangium sp. Z 11]|nr:hypothetical protein BGZ50_002936 [Haplosporangium sp. Z 11]
MRIDDSDQDEEYHTASRRAASESTTKEGIDPEDFERLVKDVVRLAVFTAHSESALKRDDIRDVLNDHTRLYDRVFENAQERLRDIFGMEMVELTSRGRSGNTAEKGTKSYMLRNILPEDLLPASIVDWEEELEDMGLLMVILSLITVRQGTIYESALISHLRRLSLLDDASPFGDIQKKFEALVKKRYLEKFKLEQMDESGEKAEYEYRWGARARIEVPEENIVKFIQEVFGRDAPVGLEASIRKASGSRLDSFLESNCTSEVWRLRLGQTVSWNLSSATWEHVPLKETGTELPPVSGMGLKNMNIPHNNTLTIVNGTTTMVESISPYMIEFGRAGCADDGEHEDQKEQPEAGSQPWIGFNIFNPVMNTWESIDLVNTTADLGFDTTTTLTAGNWLSPTVAVDYVNMAWYIILQSTAPLRQVILKKDVSSLTSFMSRIDLTESSSTHFPKMLLNEGWKLISVLDETAPFVGKGVATIMRDNIVIISGTANSFTPGDAQSAELRGCDHAYVFSLATNTWTRQNLTVENNEVIPDTREKAAFLAVGNKIYMHGGVKPYQNVLSDFWILDTDNWIWRRGPDGPGPRADHTLLQYYDYIFAVSGFDVGRNVPVASVLPVMAYDTNSTAWTELIRPTLDTETSFITNVTRIAIVIGTVVFAVILLVMALSTHLLRKWNQRNYTKVDESFQLEEQRMMRTGTVHLPSILKKNHPSKNGVPSKVRGFKAEVIFEHIEDEYGDEEDEDEDENRDSFGDAAGDDGDQRVQKVSLLSQPSTNPTSRPLQHQRSAGGQRRVRIEVSDDGTETEEEGAEDKDFEETLVIVKPTTDLAGRG